MRVTLLLSMACVHAICTGQSQPAGADERLLPQNPYYSDALRSIVEEKLLTVPANCGRVLYMDVGPLAGESAISINCQSLEKATGPCYVTATRALKNIESVVSEHEGENNISEFIRGIQVKRKKVQIAHSTAIAFRSCLIAMMPKQGDSPQPPEISDHDRVEFSISDSINAPLRGERGERPEKRVRDLVQVAELLGRYCNEGKAKRAAIVKQIEREVTLICRGRSGVSP
jgi:hypothetical protein